MFPHFISEPPDGKTTPVLLALLWATLVWGDELNNSSSARFLQYVTDLERQVRLICRVRRSDMRRTQQRCKKVEQFCKSVKRRDESFHHVCFTCSYLLSTEAFTDSRQFESQDSGEKDLRNTLLLSTLQESHVLDLQLNLDGNKASTAPGEDLGCTWAANPRK